MYILNESIDGYINTTVKTSSTHVVPSICSIISSTMIFHSWYSCDPSDPEKATRKSRKSDLSRAITNFSCKFEMNALFAELDVECDAFIARRFLMSINRSLILACSLSVRIL